MATIDTFKALPKIGNAFPDQKLLPESKQPDGSFGETLGKFISDVNEMQVNAGDKTMKFAAGQIQDIHEVMAAAEEASISMMLLMEIRKKALEGYQELMRTPV